MADEWSRDAILNFLRERGGRVPNTELVDHFKSRFPTEPKQKAAAREFFKNNVDSVGFVKTDGGVKYVCLKKKYRQEQNSHTKQEKTPKQGDRRLKVSGRDVITAEHSAGVQTSSNYKFAQVPHAFDTSPDCQQAKSHRDVCIVVEDYSAGIMGNRGSVKRDNSVIKHEDKRVEIPVITVIQPSPLLAQDGMFILPEPDANAERGEASQAGQVETSEELVRDEFQNEKSSDVEDDAQSLSGSEGTPRSSRKHFIEVMMGSSPQVRRNIDLRRSSLSPSDSDSASMLSCDEDRTPVTLDLLEHEWMMCASDAEWTSLQKLLNDDPGLVLKKDFVTGFTCLHWAAKQGKPELIALIVNFAKQNNIYLSVDVRSNTGYTPLHVAAMQNHMDVVKLLVGAYNADVEIRDYSGRKACQYLTDNVSVDIRDIIGAYEVETENKPSAVVKRWRFTKVIQAKAKAVRRLNSIVDMPEEGDREKPVRRRSSLSRMKPKLEKLRWRTSQLVHSTTFHGREDLEKRKAPKPKTHYFD